MKLFGQAVTLLLAFSCVLVINLTQLIDYQIPILGFIILVSVIFIILRQRKLRSSPEGTREETFVGSNKEVFMITLALLITIFLTGGLSSNLFFLLYFLLFGIVFLFEPPTVFIMLLGLIAIFFPSLSQGDLFSNLIKLASLAFLAPISYFFGREFQKRDRIAAEISDKTGQIIEDAEVIRSRETDDEIIEEARDIEEKATKLRGIGGKKN